MNLGYLHLISFTNFHFVWKLPISDYVKIPICGFFHKLPTSDFSHKLPTYMCYFSQIVDYLRVQEINKRAAPNKRVGKKFPQNLINVLLLIRPCWKENSSMI